MSHDNHVVFHFQDLRPVIQEALDNQCQLLLVKDHGLYFMSEKGPMSPQTKRRLVAYAGGFNPDTVEFDDWYDRLREICGGDDFSETISVTSSPFQDVLRHQMDLEVAFTPTQYEMCAIEKK
jgi:hypothetical protein